MNLIEILSITSIHWVSDFIFQDERWAINKSKNFYALLNHTFVYSILWYLPLVFLTKYNTNHSLNNIPYEALLFVIITFIFHTTTDYFTSKIVSKKFENKHYGSAIPNLGAFTIIGFDQVLHYFQLFITYYILFK